MTQDPDFDEVKPRKYVVWATADQGDGRVMSLGTFEDPTEIEINTSIIGPNVLITIEEETEDRFD